MTQATEADRRADLVLIDDASGAVVVITATPGRRWSLDRVLVFLADGVSLWYNRDFGTIGHQPDLTWEPAGRAERVRVSTHTVQDTEPAEHLAAEHEPLSFRIPLTIDLLLDPLSMPVPRHREFPDGALQGAQVFRAVGTVAAGSVIYQVRGQAWTSRSGFSAQGNNDGVRLQASFQDDSSLAAIAPAAGRRTGPAAVQERTVTTARTVSRFEVRGPKRRIPVRLQGAIDEIPAVGALPAAPAIALIGGYRSLDQHLAFVQPGREDGQWVRRAFTPFDVARSGVTGFGVLEQVEVVASTEPPAVIGTGIPETF